MAIGELPNTIKLYTPFRKRFLSVYGLPSEMHIRSWFNNIMGMVGIIFSTNSEFILVQEMIWK